MLCNLISCLIVVCPLSRADRNLNLAATNLSVEKTDDGGEQGAGPMHFLA